jgi:hypothetical protein
MADNVEFPVPAGAVLASDDILGVHVLRAKVQVGADGSAQDVSEEHPMPVVLSGALPEGESLIGSVQVAGGTIEVDSMPPVAVASMPSLPAGSNSIGSVAVSSLPSLTAGSNAIGSVSVSSLPPLAAGSNAIGSVSVSSLPSMPGGSNTVGSVHLRPLTSGGSSVHRRIGLTTSGVLIKSSAGSVYGWHFANIGGSDVFVKLYDMSTAPTVGTSIPKLTVLVPTRGTVQIWSPQGISFTNGIGIGCATGILDSNSTAPPASSVVSNLFFA